MHTYSLAILISALWNRHIDIRKKIERRKKTMMDPQTKAVWDFMRASYKSGLLDESLGLLGNISDPELDLGEGLGNFEDALTQADFTAFETMSDESLTPMLQALSEEEVIEGLTVLVSTFRPVIEGMVEGADGDIGVIIDMVKRIGKAIVSLKPAAMSIAPIILQLAAPTLEKTFKEKAGQLTGSLIQYSVNGIVKKEESDPEFVSRFMSDVFKMIDADTFRKATDTLTEAFLDQNPPIVGWTTATIVKRAKKRLRR
jgi:hypothetical protein